MTMAEVKDDIRKTGNILRDCVVSDDSAVFLISQTARDEKTYYSVVQKLRGISTIKYTAFNDRKTADRVYAHYSVAAITDHKKSLQPPEANNDIHRMP